MADNNQKPHGGVTPTPLTANDLKTYMEAQIAATTSIPPQQAPSGVWINEAGKIGSDGMLKMSEQYEPTELDITVLTMMQECTSAGRMHILGRLNDVIEAEAEADKLDKQIVDLETSVERRKQELKDAQRAADKALEDMNAVETPSPWQKRIQAGLDLAQAADTTGFNVMRGTSIGVVNTDTT